MFVESDVNTHFQRFLLHTESYTTNIIDGFSGFLYNLSTEAKSLVEKHCKNIDSTVKKTLSPLMPLCKVSMVGLFGLGGLLSTLILNIILLVLLYRLESLLLQKF